MTDDQINQQQKKSNKLELFLPNVGRQFRLMWRHRLRRLTTFQLRHYTLNNMYTGIRSNQHH